MAIKFEAIIFTEENKLKVAVIVAQNEQGCTQQELDVALHLNHYVGNLFESYTTTVVSTNQGDRNVH